MPIFIIDSCSATVFLYKSQYNLRNKNVRLKSMTLTGGTRCFIETILYQKLSCSPRNVKTENN